METSPAFMRKIQELKERLGELLQEDSKLSSQCYLTHWLRANRFDVGRAAEAIRTNRKWRRDNKIDALATKEPDPSFMTKFPYFYDVRGNEGRPVVYLHAGILDIPALMKEFGREETLRHMTLVVLKVEKAVCEWENGFEGPLKDEATALERTPGSFYMIDTGGLTLKKVMSAQALAVGLEWTRICVNYFPSIGHIAYILNVSKLVPLSLFNPIVRMRGVTLAAFPSGGGQDKTEEFTKQIFSVIQPEQLEELQARAATIRANIICDDE